jgi:hypothetical protein
MKRITDRKLLRASQALLALTDCDDADKVFADYHHDAVQRLIAIDGYSSSILDADKDMPNVRSMITLASHLAVRAVPGDDDE